MALAARLIHNVAVSPWLPSRAVICAEREPQIIILRPPSMVHVWMRVDGLRSNIAACYLNTEIRQHNMSQALWSCSVELRSPHTILQALLSSLGY